MGKGIGGFVSGLFGSENDAKSKGRQVNSQNYNYGGSETGAEDQAKFYTQQGDQAQNRQATQAEKVNIDYSQAQADRTRGMQARQQQTSLANIMQQRARLVARRPSRRCRPIARCSRRRRCEASQAGSARGAGGLAAAQRNAAFNTANMASDISGQAQINAAGERRDDTNAAAGMWSNVRGGDLASQGRRQVRRRRRRSSARSRTSSTRACEICRAGATTRGSSYDQLANQVRTTQLGRVRTTRRSRARTTSARRASTRRSPARTRR